MPQTAIKPSPACCNHAYKHCDPSLTTVCAQHMSGICKYRDQLIVHCNTIQHDLDQIAWLVSTVGRRSPWLHADEHDYKGMIADV